MKTLNKTLLSVAIATSLSVPFVASAQEMGGLDSAASGFSTQFVSSAAVIGGAMITAAFGAIVWKWVKGMIFS